MHGGFEICWIQKRASTSEVGEFPQAVDIGWQGFPRHRIDGHIDVIQRGQQILSPGPLSEARMFRESRRHPDQVLTPRERR